MSKLFRHSSIVFLTIISFSFCQKTADFLILDSPKSLTILNQYQEHLTESERAAFVPGTPLLVVDNNETLGDQITRALSGTYEGKRWYVQKDDAGNLLGAKRGESQFCKGCEIAGDTVEIIADRTVRWTQRPSLSGREGFLSKGEKVRLVFRCSGQWYVERGARPAQFGWCPPSSQAAWRSIPHEAVADTGISDFLQDRILERLRNANETYKTYFANFNRVTRTEKTAPQWRWEAKDRTVRCWLNAPYQNSSLLDESSRYLVRDIENMLAGKPYDVVLEKTDIVVRPRAGDVK